MRTYFFAAENKESMSQWMNALSLASICQQEQKYVKREKQREREMGIIRDSETERRRNREGETQREGEKPKDKETKLET